MTHTIHNAVKSEIIDTIRQAINERWIYKESLSDDERERLETALRVALGHLDEGDTTKLGTAVNAIFEMYRRNDVIDESYRNAARFILGAVDGVPTRYERHDDDRIIPDSSIVENEKDKIG